MIRPSTLRLADLRKPEQVKQARLMNWKVPDTLAEAIDALAERLQCGKTAVVVALLNEGLEVFEERRSEFAARGPDHPPRRHRKPKGTRSTGPV